jgi:hypothetical protein
MTLMKPITVEKTKLLLVEGTDDKDFFIVLLNQLQMRESDIQIIPVNGKEKFIPLLQLISKVEGFSALTHLGLVRDADNNAQSAFDSLANSVKKVGLMPPTKGDTFRMDKTGVSVGIFIMPKKFEEGMLEDLCLASVQESEVMPCINRLVECLKETLPKEQQPKNFSKMKAHAFLAAMPEMVNTIGLGARKGYWDFNAACMKDIKDFLKQFDA